MEILFDLSMLGQVRRRIRDLALPDEQVQGLPWGFDARRRGIFVGAAFVQGDLYVLRPVSNLLLQY